MKKVLVVVTTGFDSTGGLATVMMNYLGHMDRTQFKIDLASTNDPDQDALDALDNWRIQYINIGDRKKEPILYLRNLRKLLRMEDYDVIHVNGNSATMLLELFTASMCNVPIRIAHGHTTRSSYPIIHKLMSPLFQRTYTYAIAASKPAAEWLYGKDYIVLNNAIDVEHYGFSKTVRERVRAELGLQGRLVVGNVGKLNPSKNHRFLLDVFCEIKNIRKDAVLVIAGGGELEAELKEYAAKRMLGDSVRFLGMLSDTSSALQAMDVFVFPSIFEGLGMALVEAQAAGLACIASDAVPREAAVSEHVQFLNLKEDSKVWAEKIVLASNYDRAVYAKEASMTIRDCGYDIFREADKLKALYMEESR